MKRLLDPSICREITDLFPTYFTFNVEEWLSDGRNYALKEGDNIAFAEFIKDGVYWVHFCYGEARGREAVRLTQKIFTEFCKKRPVKILLGLIHVDNRKASWVVRQAGFSSLGEIITKNGLCEMFYIVGLK